MFLSSTAHVKRRVNLRGPPRKAKYSMATDSEQVP